MLNDLNCFAFTEVTRDVYTYVNAGAKGNRAFPSFGRNTQVERSARRRVARAVVVTTFIRVVITNTSEETRFSGKISLPARQRRPSETTGRLVTAATSARARAITISRDPDGDDSRPRPNDDLTSDLTYFRRAGNMSGGQCRCLPSAAHGRGHRQPGGSLTLHRLRTAASRSREEARTGRIPPEAQVLTSSPRLLAPANPWSVGADDIYNKGVSTRASTSTRVTGCLPLAANKSTRTYQAYHSQQLWPADPWARSFRTLLFSDRLDRRAESVALHASLALRLPQLYWMNDGLR